MDIETGSRLRWLRRSLDIILFCSIIVVATFLRTRPWIVLQAAPKYLIVGGATEQASMNRFCVAYAIMVANLTHRELVVPGFKSGALRDPDLNGSDYFDFWEPPELEFTTISYIRMHRFLKMFRLDSAKMMQHDAYQPFRNLSSPERFAKRINDTTTWAFLDFRREGQCWMMMRFKQLRKVVNALAKPRKEIVEFATSFLDELGPDTLFLHWRSLTDDIRRKIQNEGKHHRNLTNHYLKCAKKLWEKTQSVVDISPLKNGVVSSNRVVVFSDVHLNYREFMPLFQQNPDLLADRMSAIKYFEDIGAANGDELLRRRLDTHRLPTTDSGLNLRDDYATQHAIITEILVRAKRLLACDNIRCGLCSRVNSEFVKHVLQMRQRMPSQNGRQTWSL